MSSYKSKPTLVERPIGVVYAKFNDLTVLESRLQNLPAEAREKIGDVRFSPDSISVMTPQLGELKLQVIERVEPTKVVFGSPGAPVPISLTINMQEISPETTQVETVIDVEIPMMLRPFVGPKLQEAADKFGDMISNLSK